MFVGQSNRGRGTAIQQQHMEVVQLTCFLYKVGSSGLVCLDIRRGEDSGTHPRGIGKQPYKGSLETPRSEHRQSRATYRAYLVSTLSRLPVLRLPTCLGLSSAAFLHLSSAPYHRGRSDLSPPNQTRPGYLPRFSDRLVPRSQAWCKITQAPDSNSSTVTVDVVQPYQIWNTPVIKAPRLQGVLMGVSRGFACQPCKESPVDLAWAATWKFW
ncbi:hypothetical protein B0T22DRAFT_177842 [Podospora appendiculata]|uniref:Uncharacterized protein n=1 Tax=Podospora appendiculata TaxID=314037 RepID=A0AAE0XCK3_9PEZI|nr:hypothetical protein B0T22DRAFT_177842 [Podospora appendiculata]